MLAELVQITVGPAHRLGLLSRLVQLYPYRKALGVAGRRRAWTALGARIDPDCDLGPRVVMRFAENVSIGSGTSIGGRTFIDAWGKVTIGRNCLINGDVDLLTAGHDIDSPDFAGDIRPITIGDHAWLPRHIIVLPGVSIGRRAVIGTGAVVTKDVPDSGVAVGNPAEIVRRRADVELRYVPTRF
jgi:maltose O-acetyltransferase